MTPLFTGREHGRQWTRVVCTELKWRKGKDSASAPYVAAGGLVYRYRNVKIKVSLLLLKPQCRWRKQWSVTALCRYGDFFQFQLHRPYVTFVNWHKYYVNNFRWEYFNQTLFSLFIAGSTFDCMQLLDEPKQILVPPKVAKHCWCQFVCRCHMSIKSMITFPTEQLEYVLWHLIFSALCRYGDFQFQLHTPYVTFVNWHKYYVNNFRWEYFNQTLFSLYIFSSSLVFMHLYSFLGLGVLKYSSLYKSPVGLSDKYSYSL